MSTLVSSTVKLAIVMTCSALVHAIGALGIASNMVNIVVFSAQGFSETVNISLVTLAVSDLLTILTAQWLVLCLNPWFQADLSLAFYAPEVQTLTGGYPHIFFSRVSAWITAFISLERAVAVTQPFKVRRIFTRGLTTVFNIAVFPVVWTGAAPLYTTAWLGEKFFPDPLNSTLLGLLFSSSHRNVMSATSPLFEVCGPITNFCIIIVCTAIIRIKVQSMARWRSKVTGSHNQTTDFRGQIGLAKTAKNQKQSKELSPETEKIDGGETSQTCTDYAMPDTTEKLPDSEHGPSAVVPRSRYAVQELPKPSASNKPPAPFARTLNSDQSLDTVNVGLKTNNPLSNKERRLVVMVSAVAAIFIACYTPLVAQVAARILIPELSSTGRYRALNASLGTVGIMLGCLNASINGFVYWRMSSNYRATFLKVFAVCRNTV